MSERLALMSVAILAITAGLYTAFSIYLAPRILKLGSHRWAAVSFLAAIGLTAFWTVVAIGYLVTGKPGYGVVAGLADSLRYLAWFGFVWALLKLPTRYRNSRLPLALAALLIALAGTLGNVQFLGYLDLGSWLRRAASYTVLVLPVIGLVLIEQLYRNVTDDSRWNAKPLCLALSGIFVFDMYLCSMTVLFGAVEADAVPMRSAIQALMLPLLLIGTRRRKDWLSKLRISRKLVFHSASLLSAGIYLLLFSLAGYYVRFFGGEWGRALQVTLVFASLVMLLAIALSGTVRAKLRVLVGKHLVRYRYDYREEWLGFTHTLSAQDSPEGLCQQAIRGLAGFVESPAGVLCLKASNGTEYKGVATWNLPPLTQSEDAGSSFSSFLQTEGWIVDLHEYRNHPSKYEGLVLPGWLVQMPSIWLVLPLLVGDDLIGFVLLASPRTKVDVNWEVRDLLKVAGRQAASYLAHAQATESLMEARKFESFNKMSAFVVHDLKNIVTQLSLMLKNAEKHRDNPEFQQDMLTTVQNSLERMKQMMVQLREGKAPLKGSGGVDAPLLAKRISNAASKRGCVVSLSVLQSVVTRGDSERLERVLGHLVQNAIDASRPGGPISLVVTRKGSLAQISVSDAGHGMTPEFVRDQLFKPFRTTKQDGMGIGTYESFQYVKELGGSIEVVSTPQVGTVVTLLLPLLDTGSPSDVPMLGVP